jgi:hypothetical protein
MTVRPEEGSSAEYPRHVGQLDQRTPCLMPGEGVRECRGGRPAVRACQQVGALKGVAEAGGASTRGFAFRGSVSIG